VEPVYRLPLVPPSAGSLEKIKKVLEQLALSVESGRHAS
jgi:hypothetical protein